MRLVSRRQSPFLASILLFLWLGTGWLGRPFLSVYLYYHARKHLYKGRIDPAQKTERRGYGSPDTHGIVKNRVIWLHSASMGEVLSIFPLIDALLAQDDHLCLVVTTTTATGKETLTRHKAFSQRLFHQYLPYDVMPWVARFLAHWQPQGAVFVESEIWPCLLWMCRKHHIPAMLVNARLSDRTIQKWQNFTDIFSKLLQFFTWISPRSILDSQNFVPFGSTALIQSGDIKEDAPPLPYDAEEAAIIRKHLGKRPIFIAASTHEGEEDIFVRALEILRAESSVRFPDLLGIIIPRHPVRGKALAVRFSAPRRSCHAYPDKDDKIWIIDTTGETGLFFHLAGEAAATPDRGGKVFLGHSLCTPGGGHNPLEPLRYRCPTAHGPYMQNWQTLCHDLQDKLVCVHDPAELAVWMAQSRARPEPPLTGKKVSTFLAKKILSTVFQAKEPDHAS